MKDNGYNLSQIGKRMPYRTPEGFFGNLEEKVWEKVRADAAVEEANSGNIRRRHPFKLPLVISSAAAAAIAIFLAFSLWLNNTHPVEMSDIESAFNNLSEEDRTYMLEIYSSDIFMN